MREKGKEEGKQEGKQEPEQTCRKCGGPGPFVIRTHWCRTCKNTYSIAWRRKHPYYVRKAKRVFVDGETD